MNINTHINAYANKKSIKRKENCHSDILHFRHIPSLFKDEIKIQRPNLDYQEEIFTITSSDEK